MNKEDILDAFVQIGLQEDDNLAELFVELYNSQEMVKERKQQISQSQIVSLQKEVAQLKYAIEDVKKNNQAHNRRIFACDHVIGTVVIKPEFSQMHMMTYQRDKYKKLSENIERQVEENRKLLNQKPKKIQPGKKSSNELKRIVEEFLDTEEELTKEMQLSEELYTDSEANAFSLNDEINELQTIAKRLDIQINDFESTECIGSILDI